MGQLLRPNVLARDRLGRMVLVTKEEPFAEQVNAPVVPEGFDFSQSPGTAMLDGGARFFLRDGEMYERGQPRPTALTAPGLERGCRSPLVSPDERWLACTNDERRATDGGWVMTAELWVIPLPSP